MWKTQGDGQNDQNAMRTESILPKMVHDRDLGLGRKTFMLDTSYTVAKALTSFRIAGYII